MTRKIIRRAWAASALIASTAWLTPVNAGENERQAAATEAEAEPAYETPLEPVDTMTALVGFSAFLIVAFPQYAVAEAEVTILSKFGPVVFKLVPPPRNDLRPRPQKKSAQRTRPQQSAANHQGLRAGADDRGAQEANGAPDRDRDAAQDAATNSDTVGVDGADADVGPEAADIRSGDWGAGEGITPELKEVYDVINSEINAIFPELKPFYHATDDLVRTTSAPERPEFSGAGKGRDEWIGAVLAWVRFLLSRENRPYLVIAAIVCVALFGLGKLIGATAAKNSGRARSRGG